MAAGADVAVVVDVLSFTTTLSVAIDSGTVVLPYRWNDATVRAYARGGAERRRSPAPVAVSEVGRRPTAGLCDGE